MRANGVAQHALGARPVGRIELWLPRHAGRRRLRVNEYHHQ